MGAKDTASEIRLARPEEYAEVGQLTVGVYRAEGLVSESYLRSLRDAARRARAGQLLVAVDDPDHGVLGTASLFTADSGPQWAERAAPGDAVMRMLAVRPDARGRGVGTALTVACIERARAIDCRRLLLSTPPQLADAHRIYRRLGFRRVLGGDWQPSAGVRLHSYELPLA